MNLIQSLPELSAVIDTLNVIVAPAAALIGALGGASIANRRAARREQSQRAENRRDAARGLMVEVLHSGRTWSLESARHGVGVAMQSKFPSETGPESIATWSENESVLRKRLEKAFIDLLLRVDDLELRGAARTCREALDLATKQVALIAQAARDGDPTLDDAVDGLFELARLFDEQLSALEASAIDYFAASTR